MSLEQKINELLKAAMSARDKVAIATYRSVRSELAQLKLSTRADRLSNAEEMGVVEKMLREQRDLYKAFEATGRYEHFPDQRKYDEDMLRLTENLLPEKISAEELEAVIQGIITEQGANSVADMGKIIKIVTEQLAGRADRNTMALTVRRMLAGV